MKRVYCLYRVSTKKQVDRNSQGENDIPMQRMACHEFAERQGDWTILKEFSEKGVSGYKVHAQDRDVIQDLQAAAERGEFDILLVFMFDRIGRIDDETPFVVEWFVKHGIEVWSTQEGQQRFETHVDKLMNYIRFWQASGESEKTSIRISSKMQQMQAEGLYIGGAVKFGYRPVDSGSVNRKGVPIRKYEIDPEEREILEKIDNMTLHKGFGAWVIADMLNKEGYHTRDGEKFNGQKIRRILKDPFYCGRLEDGSTSEALKALRLRSEEDYARILTIMDQRSRKNEEKRHVAIKTRGRAMLSGNIFCAHCGGRLTSIHYTDSYTRADKSVCNVDQVKYSCYHKTHKLCECDGQTTYLADKVDKKVTETIHEIFSCMQGAPEEDRLQELLKKQTAGNRAKQKKLTLEIGKNRKQLEKLQMEIPKALTGDSPFSADDLTQAIRAIKERVATDEQELERLKQEEMDSKQGIDSIMPAYRQFKSWAEEFDTANNEQKKMIACQLFNRIELGRGYKITMELNMTYQQFCSEWNAGSFLARTSAK